MTMVAPKTIVITSLPSRSNIMVSRPLSSVAASLPLAVTEGLGINGEPKKRKRLTNLSPEERLMRRKLKNRVAAQTARDRKKQRMDELEVLLAQVEADNKRLQAENDALRRRTGKLSAENSQLKEKLGGVGEMAVVSESPESAVLKRPQQQEQIQTPLPSTTPSRLLQMMITLSLMCCFRSLEEFSQSIKQEEEECGEEASLPLTASPPPTTSHMVGPTSTELESLNELIRFDHVYVKSEQEIAPAPAPATRMVSVLRPIQPKTTVPTTVPHQPVKQQTVTPPVDSSDAPLNLNLGDMDLEALSESIEGLVDFDTMFKDLVQTQDSMTAANPVQQTTTSHNAPSLKRKLSEPDFVEIDAKKVKSDDVQINLSVEASFPEVLTTPDPAEAGYTFDFDSSLGSSSGYISDNASSPKSDDSGLLDWEDQSFSLFPDLL